MYKLITSPRLSKLTLTITDFRTVTLPYKLFSKFYAGLTATVEFQTHCKYFIINYNVVTAILNDF